MLLSIKPKGRNAAVSWYLAGPLGNVVSEEPREEVLPWGRAKEQVPPQKSLSVLILRLFQSFDMVVGICRFFPLNKELKLKNSSWPNIPV